MQCRESAATGGESVLVSGAELLAALSNEELRNLMQPGGAGFPNLLGGEKRRSSQVESGCGNVLWRLVDILGLIG